MLKAIAKLIIASAGLWLALPAAAQFEIDPDHFDYPDTNVVQARPEQSKRSTRIPSKQVQRHRVQEFKGTKSPANSLRTLSSATASNTAESLAQVGSRGGLLTEQRVSNHGSHGRSSHTSGCLNSVMHVSDRPIGTHNEVTLSLANANQ